MSTETRKLRRKTRWDFVQYYKMLLGCTDCGYCEDPVALDFDHIEPGEKINAISNLCSRTISTDRFLQEISKCDVVCANHHRIRTKLRKEGRGISHLSDPSWEEMGGGSERQRKDFSEVKEIYARWEGIRNLAR